MAIILNDTVPVVGYLTDYFDGDAPNYNRYGKLLDTGIKIPVRLNVNSFWPSRNSGAIYDDEFGPPLVVVETSDFESVRRVVYNQYKDSTDTSAFFFDLVPLESEYVELLRDSNKTIEPGTTFYRIVKYPNYLSSTAVSAVKSISVLTDPVTLQNHPQIAPLLQPLTNPQTGQRMPSELMKYFMTDRSIQVYDVRGFEEDFALGIIVVADVRSTPNVIVSNSDFVQPVRPDVGVPVNPFMQYMNTIQKIIVQLQNVSRETVALILEDVQSVSQSIQTDQLLSPIQQRDLLIQLQAIIEQIQRFTSTLIDEPVMVVDDVQIDDTSVVSDSSTPVNDTVEDILTTSLFYEDPETYVFRRIRPSSDVVENVDVLKSYGMWSGKVDSLNKFYTSSNQSSGSKSYYYDVYSTTSSCNQHRQFSVTYAHRLGSGSLFFANSRTSHSPSKVVYRQLQMLLHGNSTQSFQFNGTTPDSVYAILIDRDLIRHRVDPGNWQLSLANISSSLSVYHLIDDSLDGEDRFLHLRQTSDVYNIVSGTLSDGVYGTTPHVWGKFYPNYGILLLDGNVLNSSCSFATNTSSNVNGDNAFKLLRAISASAAQTGSRPTHSFDARCSDVITYQTYFLRVGRNEYNYSNNPTWVSGSFGDFVHTEYKVRPTTYITSVGLYNEHQELLAVAKLPNAVRKSELDEYLLTARIRLV